MEHGNLFQNRRVMNLENITNSHIKAVIDEYIHSERDRMILLDRFCNGYTYERIAEKHDMSTVQIKRIVYKNEMTLFIHL
jgi:DNA-directed RNA polymerase specialized sigma24 family protein